MSAESPSVRKRLTRWLVENGRSTFLSADFILGLVVALAIMLAATRFPTIKKDATTVLFVEVGLGMATLGVIVVGLSILVAFLGDHYIAVLKRTPLGVIGAIRPFKIVAIVCGVATLSALVFALIWSALPSGLASAALAAATGAAVWAVVGTVQLVGITAKHGEFRSQMPEILGELRRGQEEQKRRTGSG